MRWPGERKLAAQGSEGEMEGSGGGTLGYFEPLAPGPCWGYLETTSHALPFPPRAQVLKALDPNLARSASTLC